MRPIRAQFLALVTAIAVLSSSAGLVRAPFFCRMMNRVVATCCCAGEDARADATCDVQVRAADCCERISTGTRAPTLKPVDADISVPTAALVATIDESVYELPRLVRTEELPKLARAPPIIGPPLFLAHCRFLT